MAFCSIGGPHAKISNLELVRTRVNVIPSWFGVRICAAQIIQNCTGLVISRRSQKAIMLCCGSSSATEPALTLEDCSQETKTSGLTSQLIPNSYEVESLLTEICNTTSVASVELKLGGFQLYMKRHLPGKIELPPPQSSAPVSVSLRTEVPSSKGSASMPPLPTEKALLVLGRTLTLVDRAAEEGLVIVHSPKVGFFLTSQTIKGNRAPPLCKQNQSVKEGDIICYVEQLDGEVPVKAVASGEIIRILKEDGEPVGYSDALMLIRPSFAGVKKLQ